MNALKLGLYRSFRIKTKFIFEFLRHIFFTVLFFIVNWNSQNHFNEGRDHMPDPRMHDKFFNV
jgi:hypothetical protein